MFHHLAGDLTVKRFTLPVILSLVSLALFILLGLIVAAGYTRSFDETLLAFVFSWSNQWLDAFFVVVTQWGGVIGTTVLSLGVFAILFIRKRFREMIFLAVSILGSALLNVLLKALFERSRPELWEQLIMETSHSFPSGHAMASATVALIIGVLLVKSAYRKWLYVLLGLFVVIIGLSRVYLGVHYPTDVVGGWLVAVAWVCAAWFAIYGWNVRGKGSLVHHQ